MTPGELFAWVAALAGSVVLVVLAIALVVALVRSITNPQPIVKRSTSIYRGENK